MISLDDILECAKAKKAAEFDRLNPCSVIMVSICSKRMLLFNVIGTEKKSFYLHDNLPSF